MNKELTSKFYVFHYKPAPLVLTEPEYIHIWAGKNGKTEINSFVGDDSGDNISSKNKFYSELSGLYWVWKNTKSDIVGSCHYRRYFTNSLNTFEYKLKRFLYYPTGLWRKRHGLIYTRNLQFWKSKILSAESAKQLLLEYDAVLPVRRKFKYSVREHYRRYHNLEDLRILEEILHENCPEYLPSFNEVLNQNRLFANNMFVLKWEVFDLMMEWLFNILFEFEKKVNLSGYAGYQERILGFLSERLITLYVFHNKLKYKELPLIYFKKIKQR